MSNRIPFVSARAQQGMAAIINRFDSCIDSQEFVEATEFSHAFDAEMKRLDRDAFWQTTETTNAKIHPLPSSSPSSHVEACPA